GLDLLSRTVLVVDTHPGSDTELPSTDRNRCVDSTPSAVLANGELKSGRSECCAIPRLTFDSAPGIWNKWDSSGMRLFLRAKVHLRLNPDCT
ncbi:MAG: hypothetical protein WBS20_12165, partial [Lysobacterales bacterium]